MKVIICGSIDIDNYDIMDKAIIESGFEITEVVCGLSKGADLLGKEWGIKNGIPVKEFPEDVKLLGKWAGQYRNKEMVVYAEAIICVRRGNSKGATHLLRTAQEKGLKVFLKDV